MNPAGSVAIVGLGAIFPQAPSPDRFWSIINNKIATARDVPAGRWLLPADEVFSPEIGAPDRVYSRRGCFIDETLHDMDLSGLRIDSGLLAELDPLFHLLLHAGNCAFRDAVTGSLDRSRVGVIIGNLALPSEKASALSRQYLGRTLAEQIKRSRGNSPLPNQAVEPLNRFVAGLPAALLARALGLGGCAYALDAACASSLYAVKLAMDELLAGRADAMLTGGLSRPDPLYTQMGFSQLRALSPSGVCSPFDTRGDGLVVGEGSGILVLKRTEDALAAGDRIYGIIRGIGLSNDVGGSLLAPSSAGQLRAMRSAYRSAEWSPADVDLIECHATGTPVGDAVEFESLSTLWKECNWQPGQCTIGSVKANIGHLLTAAGSAALIKTILAMQHGILPPTPNFATPAPGINLTGSPFRVLKDGVPWERRGEGIPRRAGVSAFGFGGINAHLLLEEWLDKDQSREIFAVTGVDSPQATPEPIAVVGMDARFGPWQSLKEFQNRVLGGRRDTLPSAPVGWWGVEKSTWFQDEGLADVPFSGYYLQGLQVPAGEFRIPPRELAEMLPQQLLMLQSAAAALADAGLGRDEDLNAGVFIGLGLDLNTTQFSFRWSVTDEARTLAAELGLELSEEELTEWGAALRDAAGPPLTANRTMGALGSIVASRIAREFRIGGPSFVVAEEENSGLRALETAVRALQNGSLERALVGAVDLAGELRAMLGSHAIRPYSPSGVAAPFSSEADGTIAGEGSAAVVLKRLSDAERDGDRIYAVIRGIGSAGGGGIQPPLPAATAYQQSLERAYEDAGVDPASISFVEASASGFPEEDRMEATALTAFFQAESLSSPIVLGSVKGDIGHSGAASGLASLVKTSLCLHQEILPPLSTKDTPRPELATRQGTFLLPSEPRYWLRNRADGPRRAGVSAFSCGGTCSHVVLEAWESTDPSESTGKRLQPLGPDAEGLFTVSGDSTAQLLAGLERLQRFCATAISPDGEGLARQWLPKEPSDSGKRRCVALIARSRTELLEQIAFVSNSLREFPDRPLGNGTEPLPLVLRDRIFYSAAPLGKEGTVAFVFPGSGNHFPGMGMELSVRWPEVLRGQDRVNNFLRSQYQPEAFWNGMDQESINQDHRAMIFGQVALGTAVSDLVRSFGIEPKAVIGYSLGESAGLFSLGAWRDRDLMLERINSSTLFTHDLAGECRAARQAWNLPAGRPVEWSLGVVEAPLARVREALKGLKRVYLLIINAPDECVVGGWGPALDELVTRLGCRFFPLSGVTTVHCEIARVVAGPYRGLHQFNTTPPLGVTFYSGAWGRSYEVNRESTADSILTGALSGIDFPRTVEAAYDDGVRLFLEMGPGASCSRMIGKILSDRPHVARAICFPGQDPVTSILRLLAHLSAERVPLDLARLYPQQEIAFSEGTNDKTINPQMVEIPIGGKPFVVSLPKRSAEQVTTSAAANLSDSAAPSDPINSQAATPPDKVIQREFPKSPTLEPSQAGAPAAPPSSSLFRQFEATEAARLQAHEAYLRFADTLGKTMAQNLEWQITLLKALQEAGGELPVELPTPVLQPALAGLKPPAFDRTMCLEFAVGSVARMLGPQFAEADGFPTRVRLPAEPLMLVDRIVELEGEPCSMTSGRVVTEHDILPEAWYLDGGRIPTCIAVEAGQADLFLSGYLGIDFITRGHAVYRLLDAVVTFHRPLPGPGTVIRYDIHIERFFRQDTTYLFRFHFEGTVNGEPLLSMRDGCAGFFTEQELAAGRGIVHTKLDLLPRPGTKPTDWQQPVPMAVESYNETQLQALRRGDLAGCFGELFAGLPLRWPYTIPSGRMKLVDRVVHIDPNGGRFGLGLIRAEADIDPEAWFLTCHFVDDMVMPGTLMYECCLHTLRIFLLRLGWLGEAGSTACEPVPGVASQLKCRGQVTRATKTVTYEVSLKELGYRPEPYALADVLMYADAKPVVEITNMSVQLSGLSRAGIEALWSGTAGRDLRPSPVGGPSDGRKPAIFGYDRINAFAVGKPSEAFGEPYRIFDQERVIARLPGPPFQFLDRITATHAEAWKMIAGGWVEAQYDVPPDAWYFAANRSNEMPFSVLLEIALQPCGWLAAYLGSALTSPIDLSFRNLGGNAVQHRPVTSTTGTLTATAKITKVATSGGMIIQNYDFQVSDVLGPVYGGDTVFGFFTRQALASQVGIREATTYRPGQPEISRGRSFTYPPDVPYPDRLLRMVDQIELFVPDGGPCNLGYIRGIKRVDPDEWFFKAHFYQDPVCPGSLGLESFIQLLKVAAMERWGGNPESSLSAVTNCEKHSWTYRGQIIPTNQKVTVEAVITAVDDKERILTADGFLSVDGLVIYQMNGFRLKLT